MLTLGTRLVTFDRGFERWLGRSELHAIPPRLIGLPAIRIRRSQNGQTRGTISTVAMPTMMLSGVPKRM